MIFEKGEFMCNRDAYIFITFFLHNIFESLFAFSYNQYKCLMYASKYSYYFALR